MKLVFINTFKSGGGAAIACQRLIESINLYQPDIETKLIYQTNTRILQKIQNLALLIIEKSLLYFKIKNKTDIFKFSTSLIGRNLTKNKSILEADIIHIHWTNNAFLSLHQLKKIVELDKPIVWTMHDMWVFTGGCHYSRGCEEFKRNCEKCIYLKKDRISIDQHSFKEEIFKNKNLNLVGCSKWITDLAKESSIGNDKNILSIPNPINGNKFKHAILDKNENLSSKTILLFTSANLNDPRKGLEILLQALKNQKNKTIHLILVGKSKTTLNIPEHCSYEMIGFINNESELIKIYNKADFFICPSSEDNLPNTIMESLACGTPVLSFDIGGISDLIQHKENGFLVKHYGNLQQNLVGALDWAVENKTEFREKRESISLDTQRKYSYLNISTEYLNLYKRLLSN